MTATISVAHDVMLLHIEDGLNKPTLMILLPDTHHPVTKTIAPAVVSITKGNKNILTSVPYNHNTELSLIGSLGSCAHKNKDGLYVCKLNI